MAMCQKELLAAFREEMRGRSFGPAARTSEIKAARQLAKMRIGRCSLRIREKRKNFATNSESGCQPRTPALMYVTQTVLGRSKLKL
jgi:hypothetical protein